MIYETLQCVLGSGENGVQKYKEQGAWDQKDQGAKESNLGSREQKILGPFRTFVRQNTIK